MGNDVEIVIEPNRRWFRLPWRELIEYRDLLFVMVSRDFTARYKQTVLGPIWFLLQPLVTTFVFTLVFNRLARLPTDGVPPMLFYLCGNIAWGYFSGCFGQTATTFTSNAGLFGKVYFPRLVVPISKTVSALFNVGLQLVTFAALWIYFKFFTAAGAAIALRPAALLLPLVVVQMAALAMGAGLLMSSLTAKYRDFAFVTGFLMQIWFYATPVIYPVSMMARRWQYLSAVNPMSGIVEVFRYALLGTGTVQPVFLAVSVVSTVLLLLAGVLAFNRTERTFIDTV
jgi:lipopolysaccharide transport system permease protein